MSERPSTPHAARTAHAGHAPCDTGCAQLRSATVSHSRPQLQLRGPRARVLACSHSRIDTTTQLTRIDDDEAGNCVHGSLRVLWFFAIIYIINHGVAFYVDDATPDLSVATHELRKDIFSVMLQFTRESEDAFPTGRMVKIITKQTEAAVGTLKILMLSQPEPPLRLSPPP